MKYRLLHLAEFQNRGTNVGVVSNDRAGQYKQKWDTKFGYSVPFGLYRYLNFNKLRVFAEKVAYYRNLFNYESLYRPNGDE